LPEFAIRDNQVMANLSWQMVNFGFCAYALVLLWVVEQK
jgi:hypothetical protein